MFLGNLASEYMKDHIIWSKEKDMKIWFNFIHSWVYHITAIDQFQYIKIIQSQTIIYRPQNEALGNKPHKLCIYSPEPRTEVCCLRLNFNISKLVYYHHQNLNIDSTDMNFTCIQYMHSTLLAHFHLSTQVYKWVPADLLLRVARQWTSPSSRGRGGGGGGVEVDILLVASCYRNWDTLQLHGPLGRYENFFHSRFSFAPWQLLL